MASDLAYAWLRQAKSDLDAAGRIYVAADQGAACHAVAKCQQAVEKTIKGLVAALNDVGVIAVPTGYSHDVERLISALLLLRRRPANRALQANLARLIHEHRRGEIRAFSALAPKRPAAGQMAGGTLSTHTGTPTAAGGPRPTQAVSATRTSVDSGNSRIGF